MNPLGEGAATAGERQRYCGRRAVGAQAGHTSHHVVHHGGRHAAGHCRRGAALRGDRVYPKTSGPWSWLDQLVSLTGAAWRSKGPLALPPPYLDCTDALHEVAFDAATLVLVVDGDVICYTRPVAVGRPAVGALIEQAAAQGLAVRRTAVLTLDPPRRIMTTRASGSKPSDS